ncbi:MAG: phosphotransferase enzyme family protein [Dehalococcoidia bacterium]
MGEPLVGGARNLVRTVNIGGRRYAGRLSDRPEAALLWEVDLLDSLSAAGMRVARAVAARDDRYVVDGLMLFEWLDGEPVSSTAEWQLAAAELHRLHKLTRDWAQRPGFRSAQDLLTSQTGGDVRLDTMPPEAVRRCRHAWAALRHEPLSVVHGDPNGSNIRVSRAGVGFIDWDEARVDASVLDLGGLPIDLAAELGKSRAAAARRAAEAWEVAACWTLEPAYAQRGLARLDGRGG